MSPKYVVAGNVRQMVQKFGPEQRGPNAKYVYVYHPDQLAGLHGIEVLRIGTYWERDDVDKFEDAIRWAEFK